MIQRLVEEINLAWSAILKKNQDYAERPKSANCGLLNWNQPELSIRGAGQEDRSSGNENVCSSIIRTVVGGDWCVSVTA